MNLFFNQRVFIPLQFIFRSCAINFKISTFYQILITCFWFFVLCTEFTNL